MSDAKDHELAAYEAVDDALRSYPLAPAPATLYRSTMARIDAARRVPKFRLSWIDIALSLFVAVMVGAIVIVLGAFPSGSIEAIRIEMLVAAQQIDVLLVWLVFLALTIIVAAVAAFAAFFANGAHYRPIRPN
jgi:hypothetical protein